MALVSNAVGDLAAWLPERFYGAHVGTLRRTFFERPGRLYCTPEALIVYLDRFRGQEGLIPLIDNVNAQQCRLPWLENRRIDRRRAYLANDPLALSPLHHAHRLLADDD